MPNEASASPPSLAWDRVDVAALLALGALVAWWFWPHLSGRAVFIGDSDRMNHFLTWLRNFTNGLRHGYIPTWNESLFGGYSVVALPYTYPNLFAALATLWPERLLIVAAGWISALLMVLAGWATYAFARDVTRERLTAFTAAVLYQSSALATLKVSQNDMSFAVLIIIPLVMLILRRVRPGNMAPCFVGLALLLTHLLTVDFLQKAAYACMLFGLYSIYRLASTGSWRTPFVLLSAAAVAAVASFPRIMTDGIELSHSIRRYIGGQSDSLDSVYTSIGRHFNFEILRAFDERILGRTFAESYSFGNIFNLHEGFLVYSSTFATLLILYGTVRHLPALLRGRRLVDEDAPFNLAFVAFCVFVVLSKLGFTIMYVLMDRIDFIHARILVAAMLPLATLAATYLYHLAGGSQHERPILPRWPQLVAAALAAGLLVAGSEHVADATAGRPIPLGISEGFTANLTVSAGSVLRVGFSLFLFAAVLAASLGLARRSPWRGPLMAFLAFLMIFQAAAFGTFQLRGDQLRSDWRPLREPAGETKKPEGEPMPFKEAGRLLAWADEFKGPTQAALSAIDRRLERDDYRTAIVCDPSRIKIFCSPHIANFWRLRLIEGYISSIPERLEILPWPADSLSQRSISFPSFASLPWPLLSLLNVKYAIAVEPALFTNAVRLPDGTSRELRPENLEIRQSPLPVTPRVFFASTVQSLAGPEAVLEALFPKGQLRPEGYDAKRLSYVEDAIGGSYSTAGQEELKASFRDQYATIEFPPAATPRFLVANERFDPYWRAYIGGKAARIYPTNVVMRGVVVPPGAREVTMIYRPYDTSGRAWAFYVAGLALFGLGCWGVGRIDRRFLTLTAAEMAWPMRRAASWLRTRSNAWTAGDERALFRSLAAISMIWAMVVVLKYLHEPKLVLIAVACPLAGLLLVRLDLRFGWRAAASADRLSTIGAFVFMLAICSASIVLWRRAGGFFGIRDTGESAAIFLSSHHVRDIVSFFLQDHAASSDPAALGYFYIHHPNFISRLLSMIGIALGMSQETLILACLMLSTLSLLLGFLALRRLFAPLVALATVGFFATSYGVYFAQAGDLLRGLHAVMLWLLVYLMALEWDGPPERGHGRDIALAALFVFIASSDWAFFVFCLVFYSMWSVYARRSVDVRHLFAWVIVPSGLTFLAYICIIVAHTGFKFFVTDLLVTYFGRMGNVFLGAILGETPDVQKFLELYRANHIVMWDVSPTPVRLRDVVTAYWQVMLAGSPWVARALFATFIACCGATLLRVTKVRVARIVALGMTAALAFGFAFSTLVPILILYLLIGLPRLRAEDSASSGAEQSRPGWLVSDLAAWVTILVSATSVVGFLFPNYVSWLWSQGASPVGLPDAAAFGLICHLLVYASSYARDARWLQSCAAEAKAALARLAPVLSLSAQASTAGRSVDHGGKPLASRDHSWRFRAWGGLAAVAVIAALHLFSNFQLYRQFPPLGPPFASALRQPEFHGKLFVANVYDGLVWYFTRGTSLITTVVPPDRGSTERFRHLRDGDDEAKYAHPDYFLCDNDPYFAFVRVARIGGKQCQMPSQCTCRDVMAEMTREGDTPVAVGPDFVIMRYRYPN